MLEMPKHIRERDSLNKPRPRDFTVIPPPPVKPSDA